MCAGALQIQLPYLIYAVEMVPISWKNGDAAGVRGRR